MFRIVYWIAYVILFPIYRFKFVGRENIPDGGCLVCGNHTAIIDAVLVVLSLGPKGEYAVMAKGELFENRFFAALLRFVRAFPVKRGEGDVAAVKMALKALRDGKKLIIFPEGTRVKPGQSAEIKPGAGMFALRGKSPVQPVFVPVGKKAFRRNVLVFGTPFSPEPQQKGGEDYMRVSNEIMARINAIGNVKTIPEGL